MGGNDLTRFHRNHNRILHIGGPRDRDLPKPGLAGADCPYRQDGHPWGSISTMSQQHINDIGWLKFQFLTAFINRNDMKWLWLWIPPLAEKNNLHWPDFGRRLLQHEVAVAPVAGTSSPRAPTSSRRFRPRSPWTHAVFWSQWVNFYCSIL